MEERTQPQSRPKFRLDDLNRPIHAPTGSELHCQGWHQEAALRMFMNCLDPAVAEQPDEGVVCGPAGKVAVDWDSTRQIVKSLISLANAETLVVQSGRQTGVFKTSKEAPRVVILGKANNPPPGVEATGAYLPIHSELAAAGWLWVGTQGVLATTYETFAAAARTHFGGSLTGRLVISGGLGGAGGAQPLAAVLNGAAFLGIDADSAKITRRVRAGYCNYCVNSLDEALRILKNALRRREAVSVGLIGNCAEVVPELAERGVCPDILTDQTAAHDPLNGYIPRGLTPSQAADLRASNPEDYLKFAYDSIGRHVIAMLEIAATGSVVFDFGNRLAATAVEQANVQGAAKIPGFVSAYLRPLLDAGRSPIICTALSGKGTDITQLDETLEQLFPRDEALIQWMRLGRRTPRFQGLPARAYWLASRQKVEFGAHLNELVSKGRLQAPVAIALDLPIQTAATVSNSAARPPDLALIEELANAAPGASWLAIDDLPDRLIRGVAAVVADGDPRSAHSIRRLLGAGMSRQEAIEPRESER